MAKLRVREDDIGLYVKHGDRKARPIPDRTHEHLWATVGITHTLFSKGDKPVAHHRSQTTIIILKEEGFFGWSGDLVEPWFIFDSDQDARDALKEIERRQHDRS